MELCSVNSRLLLIRDCVEVSLNVDREQPTCTSMPEETRYRFLVSGCTSVLSNPQHPSSSAWDPSYYKFLRRQKKKISWKYSTASHKQNTSAENKYSHSSTLPSQLMTAAVQFMPPSSKGDLSPVAMSPRQQLTHCLLAARAALGARLSGIYFSHFKLLLRYIYFSTRDEFYYWNAEQL